MFEKTMRGAAHAAWLASCWAPHHELRRAQKDPAEAQASLLDWLLRANASSAYGREYGFSRLRNAREFQSAVPIVDYDELRPWIERSKGC
jgi:hypothetical protein